MSEIPRVTVVIPCFELGRWLPEAVASVEAQSYRSWEIVIVDDGSHDAETRRVLDGAAWPRTRVLREPHRGVAAARNAGLAAAKGELVSALDADDRLRPTFLEKAVAAFDADPGLTFVSSWLRAFGDEEWDWIQTRADLEALLAEDTVHTAALTRRAALESVGGWDTDLAIQGYEDWDLWLSLVERGNRGLILPEILFDYRRRPGSLSEGFRSEARQLELLGWLQRKHAASYRDHLDAVLARKDADTLVELRHNDALEREIAGRLGPSLALGRAESERLAARLAALEGAARAREAERALVHRLDAERHRAEARVRELEASWSWRLTAPLRRALGLLRGEP